MTGRPDARLRAARISVVGVFSVNGFLMGTWLVRIPAVQQGLGLGEGLLGLALLGSALGALLAMPSVGALVSRAGSRRVVGATALALCLVVVLPAVAPNLVVLFAAIALLGAANGGLDVSMNSQSVAVERG